MSTVLNLPEALVEVQKNWTISDFRMALALQADEWAQLGYSLARDWETCKPLDEKEAEDCRQMAELRNNECHHVRAPFAWAAFYAPEDTPISELFSSWAEGLRREAKYDDTTINAMSVLSIYREDLAFCRQRSTI